MPKTMKGKSARKPLTDISNASKSSKPGKKSTEHENDSLDRLLLVHSDLSKLIHQIDDLVINAYKLKLMHKLRNHEVESFTHVLSHIESNLQPWLPRFQQAFCSQSTEFCSDLTLSLATATASATEDDTTVVSQSSEEPELFSLVSPSPLVSWRAGCKVESERQLFLLTPLPRPKVLSTKRLGSPRLLRDPSNTIGSQKLSNAPKDSQDYLPESVSKHSVIKTESRLECEVFSPEKFPGNQRGLSTYLMTPCLKMSPPKTCMLLEPISEICLKENNNILEKTPLDVRFELVDEPRLLENSRSQIKDSFASKHPQPFGLQIPEKSVIGKKGLEETLNWFLSPPKTCVLMGTPIEKLSLGVAINDPSSSVCAVGDRLQNPVSEHKEELHGRETFSTDLDLPESTPIWENSENKVCTGEKPGECTLKRELWTKFEAASANILHLDVSILKETASKGFLERLEEASCEEMGSGSRNSGS